MLLLDRTAALPSTERAVEDTPLEEPLERVVLLERAELLAPLERVLEVLLLELLTPLERVLLLLERVALPLRRLLS